MTTERRAAIQPGHDATSEAARVRDAEHVVIVIGTPIGGLIEGRDWHARWPHLTGTVQELLESFELGRSSLTADPPSRLLEHHHDVLSLHVLERVDAHLAAAAGARRQASADVELRTLAEDHRSLDDVLELAHVARPGIRLEHLHGLV